MTQVNLQVAQSSDDAQVRDVSAPPHYGNWDAIVLTGEDRAGYYAGVTAYVGTGMRFQSVPIPKGAIIDSAYLILTCAIAQSGTVVNTNIEGEDVDNALTFSNLVDYNGRVRTSALVPWDAIPAWSLDVEYTSPDIKTIVQEIIDRAGWASGNNMVIFWEDDGSTVASGTNRIAYAYDGSTTKCPKLQINYHMPKPKMGGGLLSMIPFLLGLPLSSPYATPPAGEPQLTFESGFEPPVYKKSSTELGGGGWDNITHVMQVYSGLNGGWNLDTSIKYAGTTSLKQYINGKGTAQRAQVNMKIYGYPSYFDTEIYSSCYCRLSHPSDLWILIELCRERQQGGGITDGHELSIELEGGSQWDLRARDLAVKDAQGYPIILWEYSNIFPAPSANVWHRYEFWVKRHATQGQVKVALDDVTKISISNVQTKYTQDMYYSAWRMYYSTSAPFPIVHYYDDIKYAKTDLIL